MDLNARAQHSQIIKLKEEFAQWKSASNHAATAMAGMQISSYAPAPEPELNEKSLDGRIYKEFDEWINFVEGDLNLKKIILTMVVPIIREYKPVDLRTQGHPQRINQEANNKEIVQKYAKKCLNFFGLHIYLKEAKDKWDVKGTAYYQVILWCKNNRPKKNHCSCELKYSFILSKDFLSQELGQDMLSEFAGTLFDKEVTHCEPTEYPIVKKKGKKNKYQYDDDGSESE